MFEVEWTPSWNDVHYANMCSMFVVVLLTFRLILIIVHRKLYSRPVVLSFFAIAKFVMDYLMFEGIQRFSPFPEQINLQILVSTELFYVIMSNFMIYSIFYADFVLPPKALIHFIVINLTSVIVAMTLLIKLENRLWYLAIVISIHLLDVIFMYLDKCIGIANCGVYNPLGRAFIYVSVLFNLIFDHLLRILYLSNLLLPIGSVFVLAEKKANDTEVHEYIFENTARELMIPDDNELNTISELASDVVDFDPEDDLAFASSSSSSSLSSPDPEKDRRSPEVFTTVESGRSRWNILRRTINKVASA
ncbi:unnamed protein product [Caenorhabditis sp. 36 PRJEB53466]|nr:unnamed protein product [Caenorhabditis sp. 36 PRJEB53466]